MAISVSEEYKEALLGHELFKKKEISREIVDSVLKDYQYSSKSVKQIAKDYGLSNYMVNKLASGAEKEGGFVKRKVRNNLARKLLKVNDIDWEGFDDTQMEYISNYSKDLREKSRQKQKTLSTPVYEINLNSIKFPKSQRNGKGIIVPIYPKENAFDLIGVGAIEAPASNESRSIVENANGSLIEEIDKEAVEEEVYKPALEITKDERDKRMIIYDSPDGFEREARKKLKPTRLERILSSSIGSFAKNVVFGLMIAATSFYTLSMINNSSENGKNQKIAKACYVLQNHLGVKK